MSTPISIDRLAPYRMSKRLCMDDGLFVLSDASVITGEVGEGSGGDMSGYLKSAIFG